MRKTTSEIIMDNTMETEVMERLIELEMEVTNQNLLINVYTMLEIGQEFLHNVFVAEYDRVTPQAVIELMMDELNDPTESTMDKLFDLTDMDVLTTEDLENSENWIRTHGVNGKLVHSLYLADQYIFSAMVYDDGEDNK